MKHKKNNEPMVITLTKGQVQGIKDAPEEFMREQKNKKMKKPRKGGSLIQPASPSPKGKLAMVKGGGLMEATAKLKAKGFEDGGMVVKDKVVAIDTSPNSGLITTKGFGAGRKT